jgi:hypothetical protein
MRYELALASLLAACSASGPPAGPMQTTTRSTVAPKETMDITRETPVRTWQFAAPRTQVWNALLASHDALGIPFKSGTAEAGQATFELSNRIRTVAGKPASRYIDCGMGSAGARADSYRLIIRLHHVLQNTSDGGTALSTSMEAWARNPAISSDPVPCLSLGLLEAELGGMVAARLQ